MSEDEFDRSADEELHALERALAELDPDEVDVELSQGVLTLTFADEQKLIINSHRAARQIWMAAFRTAWHFSPTPSGWRTQTDELRSTLTKLLSEKLKRQIQI
jgi:CyaY protein